MFPARVYMGVSKNRGTPKMDGLQWKTLSKWMIWGWPYFWETPIFEDLLLHCIVFGGMMQRRKVVFRKEMWLFIVCSNLNRIVLGGSVPCHHVCRTWWFGDIRNHPCFAESDTSKMWVITPVLGVDSIWILNGFARWRWRITRDMNG